LNLTTAADLADQLGIDEAKLHELRLRKRWPHLKLGRSDVRFTDAQIEEILAIQSARPGVTAAPRRKAAGLTARSSARGGST
jgi:hypothetical protein